MDNYLVPAPENPDEVADYFVEQSTAIRELELKMWYRIGRVSIKTKVDDAERLRETAREMHKHISDILASINFFEKYPTFNSIPFNKATSWFKIKKDLGYIEKRSRRSLKKVIEERLKNNKQKANEGWTGMDKAYWKGKADEDMELLKNDEKKEV